MEEELEELESDMGYVTSFKYIRHARVIELCLEVATGVVKDYIYIYGS